MDRKVAEATDECSDSTRLCSAKSAIRQLKADVKAMDVLIGAKSATLMGKQMGRRQAGEENGVQPPFASSERGGFGAPPPACLPGVSVFFCCSWLSYKKYGRSKNVFSFVVERAFHRDTNPSLHPQSNPPKLNEKTVSKLPLPLETDESFIMLCDPPANRLQPTHTHTPSSAKGGGEGPGR